MKMYGHFLINARYAKGWTQRQAADAGKVSIATYNRAEHSGEIQPPNAKDIAEALGLDLSEIMIPVEREEKTA